MRWIPLAFVAGGVLFAPDIMAAPNDGPSNREAIQRRKYDLNHELRLSLGSMPLDAYQKGWSVSLGYTLHLNDYLAWELIQITGALLSSTDLRDELIDFFAVPEEDFAAPRLMVTTGIELAPFYGKQTVLNDRISHQQLLVGAYAGFAFGDRGDIGATLEDFRPLVGAGIGYRVFVSQSLSLRIDARDFVAFRRAIRNNESFKVENILLLTLSASFGFGGDGA
ncbi:MAG: outer membrane beta-barrel domain-containing protein [Myxococcota bacterium]